MKISVETEAREILAESLERDPVMVVDLLSMDEGADIEFEPERAISTTAH